MAMMKRMSLFLLLNFVVMGTLMAIVHFFGLGNYTTAYGMDYTKLAIFCLVWGMGGAMISLMLSKWMAKMSMGVQIIDPNTRNPDERALVELVHRYSRQAGLSTMPEVGIYDSPEVNAFATGPTRNNSLVAVSTGLLRRLDQRSVEGVIGHEVAHIANGDMVTMALLQGVVNAFVMAAARVIAMVISNALKSNDDRGQGLGPLAHFAVVFVLEMVFMIIGSMILMWFSRQREFRADKGGAQYAGRDAMISALASLQRLQDVNYEVASQEGQAQPAFASMKISATKPGFAALFRTHPTLEERILRLQRGV